LTKRISSTPVELHPETVPAVEPEDLDMKRHDSIGLVLLAGATCLVVISIVFVVQHARKREPRSRCDRQPESTAETAHIQI